MIASLLLAAAIAPVPSYNFPRQDLAPIDAGQIETWRASAWAWCNRDGADDPAGLCMINQDNALAGVARSMRMLADPGEQAELADAARSECPRMFAEHQANDLRILNQCLDGYARTVRSLRFKGQ